VASDALIEEIVDTAHEVFGRHPGARALHSKGFFCEGTFRATAEAAKLCRAAHLQGEEVPVMVRFSNASGNPEVHDGQREGRGIAVRFRSTGGETDLLCVTTPTFLARNAEDFLALMQARVPDPETGQPDLEKVGAYLQAHPEAMPAVQATIGLEPPASFAQLTFNSLHAFRLLDGDGNGTWVRYQLAPVAGEKRIPDEEAMAKPADYLRAELAERLASAPAAFELILILAEEGDPTADPTAAWPEDRRRVSAGRLELTALIADPEQGGEIVVLDPTRVIDGIELPDDPILDARTRAYSISAERRAGG
jgi:catalase